MYKKRKVKSLQQFASSEMIKYIAVTFEKYIKQKYLCFIYNDIDNIYSNNINLMWKVQKYVNRLRLGVSHRQEMLVMALNYAKQVKTIWSNSLMYLTFLELFLNVQSTILNIPETILPAYYNRILDVIVKDGRGSGLLQLNIAINLQAQDMNKYAIINILKNCKHLEQLTLGEASNELLKSISENCENLKILKLNDSHNVVTELGIQYLHQGVCRNTLTSVEIDIYNQFDITPTTPERKYTFCSLILNLENLNSLPDYNYLQVELLFINKKYPIFKTRLKDIVVKFPKLENMKVIVNMCPYLEKIDIYYLTDMAALSPLSTLNNLVSLKIITVSLVDLMPTLKLIGTNLIELSIQEAEEIMTIDIEILAEYCPKLRCLSLMDNVPIVYTGNTIFRNIKEIVLLYMENDDNTIQRIIHNHSSTDVESIIFRNFTNKFTDADIERIFTQNAARNKFQKLKKIDFYEIGDLTEDSIQTLTENCPMLDILIDLRTWELSDSDVDLLQNEFMEKNAAVIFGS